jgi:hypothetical protein
MLPIRHGNSEEIQAYKWRQRIYDTYQKAKEKTLKMIKKDKSCRAKKYNLNVKGHKLKVGDRVWVYMPAVKNGYNKKLVHHWCGPYVINALRDDNRCDLLVKEGENFFPTVHISRVKLCIAEWQEPDGPEFDFDEALLTEDKMVNSGQEFEVERILDYREHCDKRSKKITSYYLIKWKNYEEVTWEPKENLNCYSLLKEYEDRCKIIENRENALVMVDNVVEENQQY